jgi:hypothetical protein
MVERRFLVTQCQHCFRSGEVHRFYLGSARYVLVCDICACSAERDYSVLHRLSVLADQEGFPLAYQGGDGPVGPRGAVGPVGDDGSSEHYQGHQGHGTPGADYYGDQGAYYNESRDAYQIAWAQEGF